MLEKTWVKIVILVSCSCLVNAQPLPSLPLDTDNAALLYYQAFLKYPEPDEVISFLVDDANQEDMDHLFRTGEYRPFEELKGRVQRLEARFREYGIDLQETDTLESAVGKIERYADTVDANEPASSGPDSTGKEGGVRYYHPFGKKFALHRDLAEYEKNRRLLETLDGQDLRARVDGYLDACSDVFELVRDASHLAKCDWGCQYSKGVACNFPQLVPMRLLSRLFQAKILKLAADGKVREAIEYCFVLDKMALHVGDDAMIPYCVAISLEARFFRLVQYLLPHAGSDNRLLTDLKESLSRRGSSPLSLSKACQMDFQLSVQAIRGNEALLEKARKAIQLHKQMTHDEEPIPSGEALVANASMPLRQYCLKSCDIIDDQTKDFSQKQASLAELTENFEHSKPLSQDPAHRMNHPELLLESAISICRIDEERSFVLMTNDQAFFNVTLLSIDLLLHRMKEGRFPDTLPEGSAKDPFTGKDFDYVRNRGGFVLAWDRDNLSQTRSEEFRRYECKVLDKSATAQRELE